MPSPSGNRNLALEYIGGLIEEGYTNTEIVRLLRDEGLGYRTQNMYHDINQFRLEEFGAAQIPHMGFDEPIPERFLRPRNIDTDYPYSAVVKYKYTDPETGEEFETGTTLYFSFPPSQADVLSMYSLRQESGIDSGGNAIDYGEPEKVYYYRHT